MRNTKTRLFRLRYALLPIGLLVAAVPVLGDTTTSSSLGFSEPELLKVGRPAGSYALSGFDTVNLFNGNLSIHLPLLAVHGRGTAGYTMTLPIYQRWRIDRTTETTPTGTWEWHYAIPDNENYQFGTADRPAYGAGSMRARAIGLANDGEFQDCRNVGRIPSAQKSQVRLTFTGSDGSTVELFDKNSDGAPLQIPVCGVPAQSGPVFVAKDGSGTVFTADAAVDGNWGPGTVERSVTGVLTFRDGTRYRFDGSNVTWIEDRNGNRVSFTYTSAPNYGLQGQRGSGVSTVTDGMGRVITVTYGTNANPCDQINFTGQSGTPRAIKICFANLGSRLASGMTPASDYVLASPPVLFADSGVTDSGTYDQMEVSEVVLPNAQEYNFYYNRYGEVARVVLPTGGHFDYLHSCVGGCGGDGPVYRRLVERQVYANGTALEGKTSYSLQEAMDAAACATPPPIGTFASITCVTETHLDGLGASMGAVRHIFKGSAESSVYQYFGGIQMPCSPWDEGKEIKTESQTAAGTTQRIETTVWVQRASYSWWTANWYYVPSVVQMANDPRVDHVDVALDDNSTSRKAFNYDDYNNQTQVLEYDYGSGAPGAVLRETDTAYYYQAYPAYETAYLVSLPQVVTVKDGTGNTQSQTTYGYDEGSLASCPGASQLSSIVTVRGNQTSVTRSLKYPGETDSTVVDNFTYDAAGNIRSHTDGRGKQTTLTYASAYNYGFPNSTANALGQTTTFTWDTGIGSVISITDANSAVTQAGYNDLLDRLKSVTHPDGGSSTYDYSDASNTITTTSNLTTGGDTNCAANLNMVSYVIYDGLGRKSRQIDATGVTVETQYDGMGRPYKISNPGSTSYWTTTSYDALGRGVQVQLPDSSKVYTWYTGNAAIVKDQAGKWRRTESDALDRVTKVIEDPIASLVPPGGTTPLVNPPSGSTAKNLITTYTYTPLGLHTVDQQGQGRTFAYDSLSRLKQADNPESGTPKYSYDHNGNVTTRTDARQVITTMTYDALNRLIQKAYSSGAAPTVSLCYDGNTTATSGDASPTTVTCAAATALSGANALGHLTWESNGNSSTSYTQFDAMGRVLASTQKTGTVEYPFHYSYNVGGSLEVQTLPSERKVQTCYDQGGRVAQVQNGTGTSAPSYASGLQYTPHGAISQMTLGNNLVENWTYSADRLQPSAMTATAVTGGTTFLSLGYDYCYPSAAGCATNNGNLGKQTIGRSSGSWTQTYGYDVLNRLASASETGSGSWSEGYVYDDYGNRALCVAASGGAQTCSPARQGLPDLTGETPATSDTTVGNWYLSNNRVNVWGYDAAGSILSITTPARSFTYDGEGRQVSATAAGLTNTYTYDGEGRRVTKTAWGQTTVYVYDAMGQLAAEYGGAGTDAGTHYLTADTLGSTRLETSGTAQTGPSVVRNYDYLPFGQEIGAGTAGRDATFSAGYYPSAATGQSDRFTGKPRDAETGLDYFGARYFSGAQGRFTSPDAPFADQHPEDPQSWNMYAYVRNNPLKNTDPNGRDCQNGVVACGNYILGGVGAVVNAFSSGIINFPNRTLDAVLSLTPTNFRFGDAVPDAFTPTNEDQRQGVQAANAVMLVSPLAEAGATALVEAVGMGARVEAGAAATVPTSIPAGPSARPTAAQQRAINEMGDAHGCNTCGATTPGTASGNWVGDHQPPTALNPAGGSQVYQPQCLQCSRQQGGQVAATANAARRAAQDAARRAAEEARKRQEQQP